MRLSEVPRTALSAETGMLKKVKSSDNGQLNQDTESGRNGELKIVKKTLSAGILRG